jgi:hypothetical protein
MADRPTEPIPPGGGWEPPPDQGPPPGWGAPPPPRPPRQPNQPPWWRRAWGAGLIWGIISVRGWCSHRQRRRRARPAHGDSNLDRHLDRARQHDHHHRATHNHGQGDHYNPEAEAGHHDHPTPSDDHDQGADAQLRPVLPGLLHPAATAGPGLPRHRRDRFHCPGSRPARLRRRQRRRGLRKLDPTVGACSTDASGCRLGHDRRPAGGARRCKRQDGWLTTWRNGP